MILGEEQGVPVFRDVSQDGHTGEVYTPGSYRDDKGYVHNNGRGNAYRADLRLLLDAHRYSAQIQNHTLSLRDTHMRCNKCLLPAHLSLTLLIAAYHDMDIFRQASTRGVSARAVIRYNATHSSQHKVLATALLVVSSKAEQCFPGSTPRPACCPYTGSSIPARSARDQPSRLFSPPTACASHIGRGTSRAADWRSRSDVAPAGLLIGGGAARGRASHLSHFVLRLRITEDRAPQAMESQNRSRGRPSRLCTPSPSAIWPPRTRAA
eukprot:1177451-Prorocentrum_minimum.AAC.4